MKIFTSGLKPHHRLDYPKMVREILRVIPPEHTAGIAYITVSGDPPLDDDNDVLGQYYERYEGEPAVIVLYLEVMRRETPRLLHPFPITWKILLAQTLFHEIGHHYQRFSHGIGGARQEDHAEAYGDRYAREAFPNWYRLIDVEYIQGRDLGLIVRRVQKRGEQMPPLIAAWIAARLCDALDYAHTLKNARGSLTGMIHRDI